MQLASADRPLILFLDSLDQLSASQDARSLVWLPNELPEHVVRDRLHPRRRIRSKPCRPSRPVEKELGGLSRQEGDDLLSQWLASVHRTLQPAQRQEVLDKFEQSQGNPLYLKLAFEEARLWTSGSGQPARAVGARRQRHHRAEHDRPAGAGGQPRRGAGRRMRWATWPPRATAWRRMSWSTCSRATCRCTDGSSSRASTCRRTWCGGRSNTAAAIRRGGEADGNACRTKKGPRCAWLKEIRSRPGAAGGFPERRAAQSGRAAPAGGALVAPVLRPGALPDRAAWWTAARC